MNKRGLFIVFEGLDRSGKSTQSKLLAEMLRKMGEKVSEFRFPNRESELGKMIGQYLTKKDFKMNNETIHLLFSANRWEEKEKIVDTLNSGTHIICDRYAYSGVAYSNAKGLNFDWCKKSD